MYKCANCQQPLSKAEAQIDHIVPKGRAGDFYNDPQNLRLVHATCNRKLGFFARLRLRWELWRESLKPCYKESIGYTCQHRVYPSGAKECGEYPNE